MVHERSLYKEFVKGRGNFLLWEKLHGVLEHSAKTSGLIWYMLSIFLLPFGIYCIVFTLCIMSQMCACVYLFFCCNVYNKYYNNKTYKLYRRFMLFSPTLASCKCMQYSFFLITVLKNLVSMYKYFR